MNNIKKHWMTLFIGVSAIAIGFLAVFLGGSLYLSRNTSISPGAPVSFPGAEDDDDDVNKCQGLSVTFATPASTATPSTSPTGSPLASLSPSASPTVTTTATATPVPIGCYGLCTTTAQCGPEMQCLEVSGVKRCANPSCSSESDCGCIPNTPAPPNISTPNPTNSPQIACGGTCTAGSSNCANGMQCLQVSGTYKCANPSCSTSANCACASGAVPSPVSNQLPDAGIGMPTIFVVGLAAILILGSLLLI